MENKIDFEGLNDTLLCKIKELLQTWLPGGSLTGQEYCCSNLNGGPGASLKVNIRTGKWADFAEKNVSGGDLISLYAAIQGISQLDAAKELLQKVGYIKPIIKPNESPKIYLTPPPSSESPPNMKHRQFGEPSASWNYLDMKGNLLFIVARYDTVEGKEFLPWSWDSVTKRWVCKAWQPPRPLYNLPELATRPNTAVLIVEGEKTADAAHQLLGDHFVVMTWPNGSNAIETTDWTPLYGRKILIWPDNDGPGMAAAWAIARLLEKKCPEIKVLDMPI